MRFDTKTDFRLPSVVFLWTVVLFSCAGGLIDASAQDSGNGSGILRPGENLKTDGIPSIPLSLADKVRKYTEARGAGVLDWHPTQRTMLISTRFANSNQVHRVSTPGGSRYQLTFFNEPVGNASFERESSRDRRTRHRA